MTALMQHAGARVRLPPVVCVSTGCDATCTPLIASHSFSALWLLMAAAVLVGTSEQAGREDDGYGSVGRELGRHYAVATFCRWVSWPLLAIGLPQLENAFNSRVLSSQFQRLECLSRAMAWRALARDRALPLVALPQSSSHVAVRYFAWQQGMLF